jgi:DNA-binding NarL/FixJ family response regulator
MASPSAAEVWGSPLSRSTASVRLAVISDDQTLPGRVRAALERDGLAVDVTERRPTVIVVGGRSDAEHLVRRARRRVPEAAIVAVVSGSGGGDPSRLLSAGADALLLARDVDAAIAATVRAAAAGQVSVPGELRQLIQPSALSHRERQILGLAVAGLTNAQIAGRLFISESTVKTHLSSAFRRLGVHSRREAAALVFASDETLRRSVLTTLQLSHALEPQKETR